MSFAPPFVAIAAALAVSCGGEARQVAVTDPTDPSPTVHVRLAHDGELGTASIDGRKTCQVTGPVVNAYLQPIVAFARLHLVSDHIGDSVHATLFVSVEASPLVDGVNIVVDPRPLRGELAIVSVGPPFAAPGHRWAGFGLSTYAPPFGGAARRA